jgi:hypothetical protein
MVVPIEWAEAGVVPYREKRRAQGEKDIDYIGLPEMFEDAGAEYFRSNMWMFGFGLDDHFGWAEKKYESKQELLVTLPLYGFRIGEVRYQAFPSYYDLLGNEEAL